jgi:hypothetical protein
MTAVLALVFGFIADRLGVGVSILCVSAFLFLGTLLLHIPRRF